MKVKILRSGGSFPTFHASTILIQTDDNNIIFDPGFPSDEKIITQRLHGEGLVPEDIHFVFNSHHHLDHCANNRLFKNARIILHKEEFMYIKSASEESLEIHDLIDKLVRFYRLRQSRARALANIISQNAYVWAEMIKQEQRLLLIDNEKEFCPGVLVVPTPGHTMGHISLFIDNKIWLAGDALVTKQMYHAETNIETLLTVDLNMFLKSKRFIEQSECRIIVPGHDMPFEIKTGNYIKSSDDLLLLC